jgi:hypothetical protein
MARNETGAETLLHGRRDQPVGPRDPRFPLPEGPASGPATVTAVLVARNEERNIGPCLNRLAWVDRILVIDDGSTDATISMAAEYTKWILPGAPHSGTDPVHAHLNDALRLVPEGWVLQIDADERVSAGLAEEVRRVITTGREVAYRVPFRTAMLGRWVQHGYWGAQTGLIRLLRAGSGRYPLQAVHESLAVEGPVGALRCPIYHLPYPTVCEFVRKTDVYTSREVEPLLSGRSRGISGAGAKAAHPSAWRLFASTARIFLWSYLRRGGFKEGQWGMATSLMLSFYALLETLKVWERAEELDQPPVLPDELNS